MLVRVQSWAPISFKSGYGFGRNSISVLWRSGFYLPSLALRPSPRLRPTGRRDRRVLSRAPISSNRVMASAVTRFFACPPRSSRISSSQIPHLPIRKRSILPSQPGPVQRLVGIFFRCLVESISKLHYVSAGVRG